MKREPIATSRDERGRMTKYHKKRNVTHGAGYRLMKAIYGNPITEIAWHRATYGLGLRDAIASAIRTARKRLPNMVKCGECEGSGKLEAQGWRNDRTIECWRCGGFGKETGLR